MKSFGVYVAGASAEIARAESAIRLLTESGVAVTFDWCAHMRDVEHKSGPFTREIAEMSADADLDGVRRASVVLLLEPGWRWDNAGDGGHWSRVRSTGAWSEVGAALALGIPVVVAQPTIPDSGLPPVQPYEHNVFLARAALVCADDASAIRAVVRLALTGSLPAGEVSP